MTDPFCQWPLHSVVLSTWHLTALLANIFAELIGHTCYKMSGGPWFYNTPSYAASRGKVGMGSWSPFKVITLEGLWSSSVP